MSTIVQFSNDLEPNILDLECGRAEHHEDEFELEKLLIVKIKPSLRKLAHDELGHASFAETNEMEGDNDNKCKFHSNHNTIQRFNSMMTYLNMRIRIHLNEESTETFQFLGRNRCDFHYCVCYQIDKRGKMTKHHDNNSIKVEEPNPFKL